MQFVIVIVRLEKVYMGMDFVLSEYGQAFVCLPVIVIAESNKWWLGDRAPLTIDDLRAA